MFAVNIRYVQRVRARKCGGDRLSDRAYDEFIVCCFSYTDITRHLLRAGLHITNSLLGNVHMVVSYLTNRAKLLRILLRDSRRHDRIRVKHHWECMRDASGVNDFYPSSTAGRMFECLVVRYWPSFTGFSLAVTARAAAPLPKFGCTRARAKVSVGS